MQKECLLCGEIEELVEAINGETIVEICRSCARNHNFPIIRKPTFEQIRNESRFQSISKQAGPFSTKKEYKTNEEDKELEKIVARNIRKREYENLVHNFHWHIQHARRLKKISSKQLADAIAEPEIIITMAEKGELPDEYERVIAKLEQFLDLDLFNEKSKYLKKGFNEDGSFDINKANLFNIKVRDLKEITEEKKVENLKDNNIDEEKEEIPVKKQGLFSKLFGKQDFKVDEKGNLVEDKEIQ